ncbi:MAG: BLUF domain-containing protein [Kordiimonas sp.]
MHHLVYISDRNQGHAGDMEQFLYDADYFHDSLHITGALWFNETEFIHMMEGEAEDLEVVFKRITNSKSHKNVTLVHKEKCTKRFFDDWTMASFGEQTYCGYIARQFGESNLFEPRSLPPERLINLLYFLEENRRHNLQQAIC